MLSLKVKMCRRLAATVTKQSTLNHPAAGHRSRLRMGSLCSSLFLQGLFLPWDISKDIILGLDDHISWGKWEQLDVSACLPDCKSREKSICVHPICSCIGSPSSQVFNCSKVYGNKAYIHKGGKSLLSCCLMALGVAFTIPIIKTCLSIHQSPFFLQ